MKKNLIFLALAISACNSTSSMYPAPMYSGQFPPDGPPNFQQGMIDGCKSAIAATGPYVYGFWYATTGGIYYDVQSMLTDRVYDEAWHDGFLYCKFDTMQYP